MTRYEKRKFSEWRRRAIARLPEIACRVFSLRSKFYKGCGGHWYIEKKLGTVIARLNDYDNVNYYNGDDAIFNQISIQRDIEMLFADVAKIEQSLHTLAVDNSRERNLQ